jgi:phosphoserine aminotransferase
VAAMTRPYNLSAGPAILPPEVFERTAAAVRELALPGDDALESKLSILEISHRSKTFERVHFGAIALCHDVLGIPRTHKVLFLQGGASTQFAMVPMNLRQPGKPCCYIDTGVWSKKAIAESKLLGETRVVASAASTDGGVGYDHIPALPDAASYRDGSYLHITSNNTIYGTEWEQLPAIEGVPLVVDLSSNIGSRPMGIERVAMGYAGAQKNLGPSGVTLAFLHEDLLAREPDGVVPTMLRYATHAKEDSLYNTPNTFGILVLLHVLEWMRDHGGVEGVGAVNQRKADKLYALLDGSALYRPHAKPGSRSRMNVTWTLDGKDDAERDARTKKFLAAAEAAGFSGLKGHRLVGGCRASIYNAFPEAGVDALVAFMREFERVS